MARELKIFPYGINIGALVLVVMDKDRQEAQRKKRKAPLWLVDPRRDAKAPLARRGLPWLLLAPFGSACTGSQEGAFATAGR